MKKNDELCDQSKELEKESDMGITAEMARKANRRKRVKNEKR